MNTTGIYIHIPFCRTRCQYCDFYSEGDAVQRLPLYIEALLKEMAFKNGTDPQPAETCYLGGGTPSQLSPADLNRIMDGVRRHHRLLPETEVTVEANPGDVHAEWLGAARAAGINRISLGIQSLDDGMLSLLGRRHNAAQACQAAEAARTAGFDNISLDLIYGIPGLTSGQLSETLKSFIALKPDHISAYALTWSESTVMGRRIISGSLAEPVDETVEQQYLNVVESLERAGYHQYEVSNFAVPGRESRHNLAYWQRRPYRGYGPSAHEFMPPVRRWNHADLEEYISALLSDRQAIEGEEHINDEQARLERIALGLRTSSGIEAGLVSGHEHVVESFITAGWLIIKSGKLIPTAAGLFRADGMARALA